MFASDTYKQDLSLTDLGIHCTEMQDQYPNIYQKGALVAGLLDIRLLKLSHGKRGLREVVHELSKMYGPKKSFSEKNFFNVPLTGEPVPQNRPFSIEVAERVRRLPPYLFAQINRLMYEKRRSGNDVIDLGMGNPSDPPQTW